MDSLAYIKEQFQKINLTLSEKQAEQFLRYYELLVEWNSFMNLTAITDFKEVVQKHFIDSVALYFVENVSRETFSKDNTSMDPMAVFCEADVSRETLVEKMIDVGTGAGFPGIPLKIIYPDWEITLLDSLNKRVKFLDTVIQELGLQNIEAVHGRAEETAQKPEYREKYSLCVSRAVANLSTLSEYCLPFIQVGGRFVSYKAGDITEEVKNARNAIQILGGEIKKQEHFTLPETDIQRSLIEIRKVKSTPKKYPRKAGTPSKQPLS